jgi:protein gp37
MIEANWHTFQVLTKRADRLEKALSTYLSKAATASHIWWGVSVEDKKYGVPRIQHLRKSAATVKFLSVEPLLEDLGELNLNGIDWVIAGGESGPGARTMEASWVDSVRLQCETKKVAFFFKQWGGVRKAKTGRLLNGRTYDELPILQ